MADKASSTHRDRPADRPLPTSPYGLENRILLHAVKLYSVVRSRLHQLFSKHQRIAVSTADAAACPPRAVEAELFSTQS